MINYQGGARAEEQTRRSKTNITRIIFTWFRYKANLNVTLWKQSERRAHKLFTLNLTNRLLPDEWSRGAPRNGN